MPIRKNRLFENKGYNIELNIYFFFQKYIALYEDKIAIINSQNQVSPASLSLLLIAFWPNIKDRKQKEEN
jgi:hypothetical protein